MLLFGIWHRATWLFVLWGGYHGALLVAHRQLQQLQRNRDWDPPPTLWNPLGWIATLSLVNLGWIFFRARSLSEAGQMWAALISPATYATHMLSQSLYLLVFAIAGAYAISLLLTDRLAKVRTEAEACAPRLGFFALLARWRWYWIPPLYALALIFLIVVTFTHGASAAQFMYDKF
jgi:alginate O-acetyltransferase complex protein AlgI